MIVLHSIPRSFELQKHGILILRFTNIEVMNDIENVIQKIKDRIKSLHTPAFLPAMKYRQNQDKPD